MARLIVRIAAMGLLMLLTYIGIWSIPLHSGLVYASLLDKHTRLTTIPPPRIIFVGGSGIALGLDSELLERELGRPVINMGVNAGFGLHYMLEEIQPYLMAGDAVVLIPEYEHFYGTLLEGDQNLLWALRIRPGAIQQLSWRQFYQALPAFPGFMQQRIREILQWTLDPIYNRNAFNPHGDFVNHLALPAKVIQPYAIVPNSTAHYTEINRQRIGQVAAFQHDATMQGVHVVLIYPAVAATFWRYQNNQQLITQLNEVIMRDQVVQELSQPSDYVLPDHFFFDTVYHLSKEGRQLRSERIAMILSEAMSTLPATARADAKVVAHHSPKLASILTR